jgi:CPA2 family monovalent cation:H+ antiporter-2
VALLLFMVGLEFSLGDFWLARRTVLMAGALQMIAVAPPLILLLMWLGQPGQSAALLGTAAAMSSTALVSRQLADQGELTTRHGRSAIAVLVFQDLASVPLLALLAIWARGESPKIEHVLLEVFGVLRCSRQRPSSRRLLHGPAGLGGAAGPRGMFVLVSLCVVVAAALLRAGRRIRAGSFSPGWCWARATSGTTWKATSGRFAMCCGRVLRDHRPATGRSTDSFGTAGGAGVAGGAGTVKILLNTLALRATRLCPRCLAHGHSVGARRRVRPAVVGHGLAAASDPHGRRQPMLVALVLSMALAPLLIRHHDVRGS